MRSGRRTTCQRTKPLPSSSSSSFPPSSFLQQTAGVQHSTTGGGRGGRGGRALLTFPGGRRAQPVSGPRGGRTAPRAALLSSAPRGAAAAAPGPLPGPPAGHGAARPTERGQRHASIRNVKGI